MHLILISEKYEQTEEPRICDWCLEEIHSGDQVWVVTLKESALPTEESVRTLDICPSCCLQGPIEGLYAG